MLRRQVGVCAGAKQSRHNFNATGVAVTLSHGPHQWGVSVRPSCIGIGTRSQQHTHALKAGQPPVGACVVANQ